MTPKNKSPGLAAPGNSKYMILNSTPKRRPLKIHRVAGWLLGGGSLNRFEAARHPDVADSCLNSTVAELEGKGILIDRVDEVVPGRYGPAKCKRYSLNQESANVARVRAMLSRMALDLDAERLDCVAHEGG